MTLYRQRTPMSESASPDDDADSARIVTTEDVLGGQPRIAGTRISVLFVHERVEGRGLDPGTVADRHGHDVADVYHALAYYHDHPRDMEQARREREAAFEEFVDDVDRPAGVSPE
jgi:uncharacterized protein (DUF433 family)